MTPVPVIRPATLADLEGVAGLIRELAEYEELADEVVWDHEGLATAVFGPDAVPRVLLAEDPDPVGYALWFPTFSTFLGRPGIWLEDLFVRPAHRGRGTGRALFEAVVARADGGRVDWEVLGWNEPARAFYADRGAAPMAGWERWRLVSRPAGDAGTG